MSSVKDSFSSHFLEWSMTNDIRGEISPLSVKLFLAVRLKLYAKVDELVNQHHANPNWIIKMGEHTTTCIFQAIVNEDPKMLKKLIEYKADLDVLDNRDLSPIMVAAMKGNKELFDILLEAGSTIEDHTTTGRTLMMAIRGGNLDIFNELLHQGVEIDKPIIADTPDIVTCSCCKPSSRKRSLHLSPLLVCAIYDKMEMARILIEKGVRVNYSTYEVGSALCQAIEHKNIEFAKLLLESGASLYSFVTKKHKRHRAREMALDLFDPDFTSLVIDYESY